MKRLHFLVLKGISEDLSFLSKLQAKYLKILQLKWLKLYIQKKPSKETYEVLDRIKENIIDEKSRYLLVISKTAASIFLISTLLKEKKKEYWW